MSFVFGFHYIKIYAYKYQVYDRNFFDKRAKQVVITARKYFRFIKQIPVNIDKHHDITSFRADMNCVISKEKGDERREETKSIFSVIRLLIFAFEKSAMIKQWLQYARIENATS